MKKLVLVTVAMLAFAVTAFAGGNTGCGIGTMIFEGKDGILWESLAVTTNGTCANQTFGITFGTLGCSKPGSFAGNEKLTEFVASNIDTLTREIAAGRGESVNAVADLLKVAPADRATFSAKLQADFTRIFPASDVTSAVVVDRIVEVANS